MNFIHEYVDWSEMWDTEVDVQASIDSMDEVIDQEIRDVLIDFKKDSTVELDISECQLTDQGTLVFVFSESGGQNESDNQGWSRSYWIEVDKDFLVISAEYDKG